MSAADTVQATAASARRHSLAAGVLRVSLCAVLLAWNSLRLGQVEAVLAKSSMDTTLLLALLGRLLNARENRHA